MKKYILIVTLFVVMTFFTGCYTVVWTPDESLPTAETYQQEYYDNGYYQDPYYGDYGYYYQYPWWLAAVPPAYSDQGSSGGSGSRSDNSTMDRIRNRDGGRSTEESRGSTEYRGTDSRQPIINNAPVTKSSGSSSGSSGSDTQIEKRGSSNNTNSGSSNTSTRSTSGSNDNKVRNSDGGRSSGGRK